MASKPRLPRGRQFFANPGPTNIPDSVLLAVAHVTVDFNDPAFMPVYEKCVAGLKRILKTEQEVFMYTGSGPALPDQWRTQRHTASARREWRAKT